MEDAFGASDSAGAWVWKDAYEAGEVAQVLFLRRYGSAMRAKAGTPAAMLAMLARVAALLPTQTRRSEESQALQQFSTPLPLGFVASVAAGLTPTDVVLEPSAGTGLLAIFAELAGATLALNELAPTRAGLLERLFATAPVSRHNAEQIHDHLPAGVRPSVVLMNPPFSVSPSIEGRVAGGALKHVASALARLAEGGRLVAITGASLAPDRPAGREAFARLQERGRVVFTAALDGRAYARHGTTTDTRLTVIDRVPAEDPGRFPGCHGIAADVSELLALVERHVPPRPSLAATPGLPSPAVTASRVQWPARCQSADHAQPSPRQGVRLARNRAGRCRTRLRDLRGSARRGRWPEREPVRRLHAPDRAHPRRTPAPDPSGPVRRDGLGRTPEAALPPAPAGARPQRRPALGRPARKRHPRRRGPCGPSRRLWSVDETFDTLSAAPDGAANAVRFRRGWFLGDGTGAGKGRQVAGVILDNWLKGRRRALWVSKSDKLIEDAQRDWAALGQERLQIVPLARFRQGAPVTLSEGVLFTTYATLRSEERHGKASRLQQIVDWLGRGFDGVIVFDEAHAMANAAGDKGERGDKAPSQQGRAGLRLQHALPDARVLYVSATGATTVQNLAYAQRLGLWGGADFPFATRGEFVQAMEAGGVAAMEVLARDLKALGLYAARSLSYEGVEVELVEHELTPEQTRIYDAYASAFQIIHQNLTEALKATNITGEGSATYNRNAKAAAKSAFESNKQRFFNHLITAMKAPTLIRAIEAGSRGRARRGGADRLDRRSAHGAAPGRDPDSRVGRSHDRYHAARVRPRPTSPTRSRRSCTRSIRTRTATCTPGPCSTRTASPFTRARRWSGASA